jgi:hypothetical protein
MILRTPKTIVTPRNGQTTPLFEANEATTNLATSDLQTTSN